jgi:hypothetical protein
MRTGVIDREHLAIVGVEDRDRWIGFDPTGLTARQGREWADFKHGLDLPDNGICIGLRNMHRNAQQCGRR